MIAGAAKVDITPPVGVTLGGFAGRYKPSEGIHDQMNAKAIYLQADDITVLLIAVDILNLTDGIVQEVRRALSKKLGIQEGAIMLAATHTHSGPALLPDITSEVEPELNRSYMEELPSLLTEAGEKAHEKSERASAKWGVGRAEITYNRRTEGGPVDPQVVALCIENGTGVPVATVVNYACHGVVLGGSNYFISADFMGYTSRTIELALEEGHVSLYVNGATGDLNPMTCKGYGCLGTFEDAQRLGMAVANSAIEALKSPSVAANPRLGFAHSTLTVKKLKPSIDAAKKYHEDQLQALTKVRESGAKPEEIKAQEAVVAYAAKNLRMAETVNFSESDEAQLQAVRVGDFALATMPGETLVRLGLELKRRSPFSTTGLVSYANGYHGYIPTLEDYNRGGYEASTTWWNRLAPGMGELMLEEDLRLLNLIRQG